MGKQKEYELIPVFIEETEDFEFELARDASVAGNSEPEITEFLKNHFDFSQPTERKTFARKLDFLEINEAEKDILHSVKTDIPVAESELEIAIAEQKRIVSNAKDTLKSLQTRVTDTVYYIEHGRQEIEIPGSKVFKIPAHGKYYTFGVFQNTLVLCKVKDIPEEEQKDLFEKITYNESNNPQNNVISEAV